MRFLLWFLSLCTDRGVTSPLLCSFDGWRLVVDRGSAPNLGRVAGTGRRMVAGGRGTPMAEVLLRRWQCSRRMRRRKAAGDEVTNGNNTAADESNDFFSLFLDETMTYSSAIFKMENEDLKVAQLRKISVLIKKARIDRKHNVLDIGCGWGTFAIEVVKLTGCKYTGITLSEEQLKYAKKKAKDAGLEENITFLLCDYRQLPNSHSYDRIISCEMLEHVGHEYFEDFFGCCESLLAKDGVVVLQFISIPEERYENYRRNSDFIKAFIFPGGSLPSLHRITSAMAAASRLCVEHLENIGIHYYLTLICWRNNFMAKRSEILALGFDEKFIRTWEYYFIYCAAGFKSRTLGDYQMVLSRPGNFKTFSDPYESQPSAF